MAVLAPVVGDPRGEELLQARQGARGEHLGAQRVLLQLLQVHLRWDGRVSRARGANAGLRANCSCNLGLLTARYPLGPPPLVRASPTFLSTSSLPLPMASAAWPATASVVFTVSFSNLTDMVAARSASSWSWTGSDNRGRVCASSGGCGGADARAMLGGGCVERGELDGQTMHGWAGRVCCSGRKGLAHLRHLPRLPYRSPSL